MNAHIREDELGRLFDVARVGRLRDTGALVLDVDDTLLAREGAGGREETFADSAPAALLPELLRRGFNLGLVTGHGWRQLESRLIAPLVERLRESGQDAEACAGRLRIYVNRGATKIVRDGRQYRVDEVYSALHQLCAEDVSALRRLLETLGREFEAEVRLYGARYAEAFSRFDFGALPPRILEREEAVLVLRPVPSRFHAARGAAPVDDARAALCARGVALLERAGLSDRYELSASGRSSIEITRRGVSKETAVRDLVAELAATGGESVERVERALVYVGDEFCAGGNDEVVSSCFPRALNLSVAEGDGEAATGIVSLVNLVGASGTAATERLLVHLLNLSGSV